MSENKNNKKIENRGENLVDITDEYNKNERSQDESESVLDGAVDKVKAGTTGAVDKVKAGTKAVVNKVKDKDKDMGTEYNREKTQ
jgi:hypothetical protein